jgi:PAS domain S-box-containing protein
VSGTGGHAPNPPAVPAAADDTRVPPQIGAGRRPTRVHGIAVVVATVGVLASTGLGGVLAAEQARTDDRLVDQRTAAMQAAVTTEGRRYVETLTTLAAGAGSLTDVTDTSFAALTAPVAEMDLPGAAGIAFVVAAESSEMSAVQAAWHARGATDLQLRPYPHDDDHLFSVLQRELGGTLAPTGLDLVASPQATAALLRGRERSMVTVSRPYELLSDRDLPADERQQSFLITAPVRTPASGTAPGTFRGWLVMAMHGEDFVGQTLQQTAEGQVHAALLADGGQGWTLVAGDPLAVASATEVRRSEPIVIADQQWLLQAGAHRADLPGGGNRLAQAVGAAGLALTAVSTALALVLTTGRRRAERQVEVATRDLRSAQEEAQRQAGLLGAVMDSLSDGVGVVDSEGRYLLSNRASRTILGIGDVDGTDRWQSHFGLYTTDGRTPMPAEDLPLVRALAGESVDDVEMLVRNDARPDGLWLQVSARPLDPRTGQSGAVAVFHDITARRSAHEASRRAEARFRDLLEAAPDAILGCDEDGIVVFANSKVDELFGYRREELLGRSLDMLVPDSVRPDHAKHRAAYLRDPVARPMNAMQLSARRKNGSLFPAEISLSTLRSEDGLIVSAAVRDVSERVRAQEEMRRLNLALRDLNSELEVQADVLTRSNAELQELDRLKSTFVATVSHELRTPLSNICGYTELLAEAEPEELGPQQRRMVQVVERNAGRLLGLIEDLLTFARAEAGTLAPVKTPVDLNDVVTQTLRDLGPAASTAGVALGCDLAPARSTVPADRSQIERVLANLLSNALKFTASGGSAVVTTQARLRSVVVSVTDDGPGIPLAEQERLFQRFYRADDAYTRQIPGTGLGLSIARAVVEAHGGTIGLTSAPGAGTTVTFELPR